MTDGVMRIALVEHTRLDDGTEMYELCSDLWVVKSGKDKMPSEVRLFDGKGRALRYLLARTEMGDE